MVAIGRKEKNRDMGIDFINFKAEPTYLYGDSSGKKIGII